MGLASTHLAKYPNVRTKFPNRQACHPHQNPSPEDLLHRHLGNFVLLDKTLQHVVNKRLQDYRLRQYYQTSQLKVRMVGYRSRPDSLD